MCLQSKHQKHQAFEAELAANADRISAVVGMGESKHFKIGNLYICQLLIFHLNKYNLHQLIYGKLYLCDTHICCGYLPSELIVKQQCSGTETAVQERIGKLAQEWESLTCKSSDKSEKLKEANRQRMYTAAVKDLEFWLGEVSC